ncbi:MAG TPA: DUF6049 family protein [Pyrinomonadaceae bacterium]|jgi:uncharacterized protein YfaS (alpha-2-macroglobulin family)|nr:DUF6049 family protein [Pyrinomonadaceae bacterium]
MILKPALSLLLVWMMLLAIVPKTGAHTTAQQDQAETNEPGLRFRVSEATPVAEATPSAPVATATSLSEEETRKLLARLPPLKSDASDVVGFKLRESTQPPPRAGKTIQAAFASPASDAPLSPIATSAPLEVTRFTPEGEVSLAPILTVTFSQPMVAVSSQESAVAHVPVTLTPQPQGKWRWLGAQTLMFQPDAEGGRMPMATNYTVTIPAGTKSALGNSLRQTKTFNFATPPLTVKNSYPDGESKPRDPLMFLEFDQRIDAARVLERLKLEPLGNGVQLCMATAEEIATDLNVKELTKQAQEGRWLAFRAITAGGATKDALPTETVIKVVVPPGTPSAEGTRTTLAEQSFNFKTYGPLRVVESQCGYQKKCTPSDTLLITLSNILDPAFQPTQLKITPEIPNVQVFLFGAMIRIEGFKRSNTTYTVTLDRGIKDVFGQTLSGDNQLTFNVATNPPGLFSVGGNFVVLDPAGPRAFTVYSVNFAQLRVRLYRVTPDDWPQFQSFQAVRYNSQSTLPPPPGQLISDKVVDIHGDADQVTETSIDLSPALSDGYGQAFILVEPVENKEEAVNIYAYRQNLVETWLQSTEIGLDAFVDNNELVVWTNSLKDGNSLGGVEVIVSPDDLTGISGPNGLTRLPFKELQSTADKPSLIMARRGKDLAILSQEYSIYPQSVNHPSWRGAYGRSTDRWYVFDDRHLYRPGEEVNIKGWIREIQLTPTGDTEMFIPDSEKTLNYMLEDSEDNQLVKGTVKLNALAGFNLKVQLPPTMNLGQATVRFQFGDVGTEFHPDDSDNYTHNFQVQEFRRPEFEITTAVSEGPYFVGSSATVNMTAAYYSGGGLAGTPVDWNVSSVPTNYTPPNRDEYTFGEFSPWWGYRGYEAGQKQQSFQGRTDGAGKHAIKLDFDGVGPARPSSVMVSARVQDVNRQTIEGSSTLLVHPADVYVGLKPSRYFVQKGDPVDIATIVTDLDGKALPDREVRLRFIRLEWVYEKGVWAQLERDLQEQTVKSGSDAVNVRFKTTEGGMYRLLAQVRDDRERSNESEQTLWVAGGKLPPQREVTQENVELIPDRRNYADGDVAEILVQSPFVPAEGVMTIRRSGLLRTERFTMNESSYTLRIPIAEALTPNIVVQVDLVGAGVRADDQGTALPNLPKRPAFASGEIKLDIPPVRRRLSVTATPRLTVLEPGAETVIDVEVKDAQGRAVAGTDTAVVVVDESVLALTDYKLADPLSSFYEDRGENVNDYHLREKISLANPDEIKRLQAAGATIYESQALRSLPSQRSVQSLYLLAPGSATETVNVTGDSSSSQEVSVRQNFNALAVFAASFPTDARGRAQVKVKLPDNLTRYRVMAVSVAGGKLAGQGESAITARKQLMARPSAPRFLNYGDRAELPVVLQNQTDQPTTVNVAVRATNAKLTEGAGRRVTVPANNRVEVRFPIAAVKPGTARFQIVAASAARTDAAEISLPVYTPATTEAFATYGVIDEGSITQPVKAPADAVETFGGLEITTASTQLQELTDAVIYLVNYPYSCSEQTASRVIAIAALKDVLTAFKSRDLPSPEALRASVDGDLKRLEGLQNEDGGFGFWRQGEPSFPFVSVHVAHAFVRAKGKGFVVSEQAQTRSKAYLRNIEQKIPPEYSIEARRAIQAYALFVRALMADRDTVKARNLIAEAGGVEKLSLEALGWLLPVVSGDASSTKETEAIRHHLNNRVTETAGAAHFADSYSDGAYTLLQSNRRADGVILDALIGDQPQSDLIPKLVRGLLGGRRHGYWTNTQENVFILLALDRYFNTYEQATPDFVARVWLGNGYAGEQAFKGRSLDRQQLNLPMPLLIERTAKAPANLTIDKAGPGRLYFRIGTRYAPSNLKLAAADYGFQLERKYEAIDDPADVQREPDGTWVIKAGARVRVHVTMSNPARRYHVALVDPLPAGLEPLNPELATTESVPEGSSETRINRGSRGIYDYYWYWRGPWYEHQNLRDERVEAFTALLWEGVHEYSYFARATTPGLFVVPPSRAEEMYEPETFGRGHSDKVRVQ